MKCEQCTNPKTTQSRAGQVCNTCPAWMLECEAREWLARIRSKNPRTRAEGLAMVDTLIESVAIKRGNSAAQVLKDAILLEQREGSTSAVPKRGA